VVFRAEEERKEKRLQKEYESLLQIKDSQMQVSLWPPHSFIQKNHFCLMQPYETLQELYVTING
jgi:hypothetical protein